MTSKSYPSPSIVSFADVYKPQPQSFRMSDYYQTLIVCSSFVLAYFYKLWPFWFVFGYFTLRNSLYWAASMADKNCAKMTSSPYTFYLSDSNSNWREFWMTLSRVFRRMHQMLHTEDCPPPPPVLTRSNTMCYNDYVYSASLGQIHISEYNQMRTNRYNKYFICTLLCIIAISSFILYCVW